MTLCLYFPQVRDQINSEHRMKYLVDRSLECAERLMSLFDDRDGYVWVRGEGEIREEGGDIHVGEEGGEIGEGGRDRRGGWER